MKIFGEIDYSLGVAKWWDLGVLLLLEDVTQIDEVRSFLIADKLVQLLPKLGFDPVDFLPKGVIHFFMFFNLAV